MLLVCRLRSHCRSHLRSHSRSHARMAHCKMYAAEKRQAFRRIDLVFGPPRKVEPGCAGAAAVAAQMAAARAAQTTRHGQPVPQRWWHRSGHQNAQPKQRREDLRLSAAALHIRGPSPAETEAQRGASGRGCKVEQKIERSWPWASGAWPGRNWDRCFPLSGQCQRRAIPSDR